MKKILFLWIWAGALLSACTPTNSPSEKRVVRIDTVFTQARVKAYGQHYAGLPLHVLSMDLFSEGLTLSKQGDTLQGTGVNLYFSDIFVSADTLSEGEYTVDSTVMEKTALSAMSFEGNITGTYLLLVKDGTLDNMYLFPRGTFIVRYEKDTCDISFHLTTEDNKTYDAEYRGVLYYE